MTVAAGPTDLPLVEAVTLVQRRLGRGLAELLADEGATLEQLRVMRALSGTGGLAMGELAAQLQVPHPTLTRVVDGLVDAGLVYRRPSGTDRRRVAVHLARRGEERLQRLGSLVAAHEQAVRASDDWPALRELLLGVLTPRDEPGRALRGAVATGRGRTR